MPRVLCIRRCFSWLLFAMTTLRGAGINFASTTCAAPSLLKQISFFQALQHSFLLVIKQAFTTLLPIRQKGTYESRRFVPGQFLMCIFFVLFMIFLSWRTPAKGVGENVTYNPILAEREAQQGVLGHDPHSFMEEHSADSAHLLSLFHKTAPSASVLTDSQENCKDSLSREKGASAASDQKSHERVSHEGVRTPEARRIEGDGLFGVEQQKNLQQQQVTTTGQHVKDAFISEKPIARAGAVAANVGAENFEQQVNATAAAAAFYEFFIAFSKQHGKAALPLLIQGLQQQQHLLQTAEKRETAAALGNPDAATAASEKVENGAFSSAKGNIEANGGAAPPLCSTDRKESKNYASSQQRQKDQYQYSEEEHQRRTALVGLTTIASILLAGLLVGAFVLLYLRSIFQQLDTRGSLQHKVNGSTTCSSRGRNAVSNSSSSKKLGRSSNKDVVTSFNSTISKVKSSSEGRQHFEMSPERVDGWLRLRGAAAAAAEAKIRRRYVASNDAGKFFSKHKGSIERNSYGRFAAKNSDFLVSSSNDEFFDSSSLSSERTAKSYRFLCQNVSAEHENRYYNADGECARAFSKEAQRREKRDRLHRHRDPKENEEEASCWDEVEERIHSAKSRQCASNAAVRKKEGTGNGRAAAAEEVATRWQFLPNHTGVKTNFSSDGAAAMGDHRKSGQPSTQARAEATPATTELQKRDLAKPDASFQCSSPEKGDGHAQKKVNNESGKCSIKLDADAAAESRRAGVSQQSAAVASLQQHYEQKCRRLFVRLSELLSAADFAAEDKVDGAPMAVAADAAAVAVATDSEAVHQQQQGEKKVQPQYSSQSSLFGRPAALDENAMCEAEVVLRDLQNMFKDIQKDFSDNRPGNVTCMIRCCNTLLEKDGLMMLSRCKQIDRLADKAQSIVESVVPCIWSS